MDSIFVSNSSMENDLKEVKKILKPYPTLKLVRHKNYISLDGNEENKRDFYVDLLIKKIKSNYLNLDSLAALFPNFDLLTVKELLENIFKKYNYTVRDMEFPVIMTYIGVAIERMLCHNYIKIKPDFINGNFAGSTELFIAQEFFQSISEKFNIELKKDENIILALILIEKTQSDTNFDLLLNSDYRVNQLVSNILEDMFVQFDVDLRSDEDLRKGLSVHIQQLLERKKKNIHIPNFYLDELKHKYPFFFEMAIRVGKLIEDKLKITIDENDISFIEQHLGGALERMNSKNKYKVIMMNPNNQALSSICIKKIESLFHERIEIFKSVNYFEKKEVLKANPDLILTTFPLEHNLNILTVQISIFMSLEDEIKIFKALNLLDSNKYKVKFLSEFKNMMEPRFFYFDLDLDTPKEVLTFMSDELFNAGLVGKNFKDAVLKREELFPTSFIYSFAIAHPNIAMSKKSKISVALLKKPIQWGEFQVKLVLLLSIEEGKQKILRIFFDWLGNIVSDSKKLSLLMKTKSYEEFINHIIK